jgi:hypothetical protein
VTTRLAAFFPYRLYILFQRQPPVLFPRSIPPGYILIIVPLIHHPPARFAGDERTVAEIMGHRNISQTMRYTHFLDAHRIEAIQVLGKIGR